MAAAPIPAEGPGNCFGPAFARSNSVTAITDCRHALRLGGSTIRPAIEAAWIAVLPVVTVPAAITRYRHAAST